MRMKTDYNKITKQLKKIYDSEDLNKDGFDYVVELLRNLDGKIFLDYGCGVGRSSKLLKNLGAKVIGVDSSKGMLALAEKENGRLNILHNDFPRHYTIMGNLDNTFRLFEKFLYEGR